MHGLGIRQLRLSQFGYGHVCTVTGNGLDLALRCAFVLDADGAALLRWVGCHAGTTVYARCIEKKATFKDRLWSMLN